MRRPGGLKKPVYNVLYGPPIFAPLLICGQRVPGPSGELDAKGEKPVSENRRPIDPSTGEPMPTRMQPGYYPGFETLSQQKYWDETTRKVVLDRVRNVPPIRFFNAEEARIMTGICDRILPQDDRDPLGVFPSCRASTNVFSPIASMDTGSKGCPRIGRRTEAV